MKAKYDDTQFRGIIIDSGCSLASVGGLPQYHAYYRTMGHSPDINYDAKATVTLGDVHTKSLGRAAIDFPLGPIWTTIEIYILPRFIPILLSLRDMDKLGVYFDNIDNLLVHKQSNMSQTVERHFGHAVINWNPHLQCAFTEAQLRRLHRRFGHPSANKLVNLLEKSDTDEATQETRDILDKISRQCRLCQRHNQARRRFRFTIRDDAHFNHSLYTDVFFILKRPILHVVDEEKRFQAARLLKDSSSDSVWRALRRCWIDTYLGTPDVIDHDAAKNFLSRVFTANVDLLYIRCKSVSIEASNTLSVVERYHEPLR